ncbi:MAG TPA: hypothetical protein PLJ21_06495 [Pseudobdellovibrionaceae bacterium]|nr:hypothetical protein [Pseudobdellovibrionaceae bacterium]
MKKFFIILSVLFGVNSQSYGFIIEANCSFDQAHGICSASNNFNRPILCHIRAKGQTAAGFWLNMWQETWIPPGQWRSTEVHANNPYNDPLVWVEGSANCRF